MSPMQRYISRVKVKDEDGNVVDDNTEGVEQGDLNSHMQPCGGAPRGRSHMTADIG